MGSVGNNNKSKRITELQKELENAKGFLAKARIRREIEYLQSDFKGTFEEYTEQKNKAWREQQEAQRKAAQERQEAERRAREEKAQAERRALEEELRTQPQAKVEQFRIIQDTNPMQDDFHVGIRKPSDIKTWTEAVNSASADDAFAWGDFSKSDAQKALKSGKITVYSSYPIKQGVFVSTSKVQAEQYAGGEGSKVYSKTIPLEDVAWINGDEGQFAQRKKKGKK